MILPPAIQIPRVNQSRTGMDECHFAVGLGQTFETDRLHGDRVELDPVARPGSGLFQLYVGRVDGGGFPACAQDGDDSAAVGRCFEEREEVLDEQDPGVVAYDLSNWETF